MGIFKDPEIPARAGALDDEAFADGSPASALVLREAARLANLLLARGGLIYRCAYDGDLATEGPGAALSFAPPYWQHLVPAPAIPVRKKYGVRAMRVRLRLVVTSGYRVMLFVGTDLRPSPVGVALADLTTVVGTGALQVVDLEVPVREGRDEVLSFYQRALVDPSTDSLLDTATYGSPSSGVVDTNGEYFFTETGATWNTAGSAQVHLGGHYVYFSDATGNTPVHGPCEIRTTLNQTTLGIYPPVPSSQQLRGSTFTIRKLPGVRVVSIACYGVDRTV